MKPSVLNVIGAGGHAKVVIATATAAGWRVANVFDDAPSRWGERLLDVEITGPIADVSERSDKAVVAIGSNEVRRRLAQTLPCDWATIVHPAAVVDDSVELGAGTVVFAGCVVQPATHIGSHVIINTGATVDHDCSIGDFAHIAPGVHLCGNVAVGAGSLVGVGSCVIPGARIGSWCVVGAGAAVVDAIPDRSLAVGVPARCRPKGS